MHNNNSELIAFGLSVSFNWPPEESDCSRLFSVEFHWQLQYSHVFFLCVHQIRNAQGEGGGGLRVSKCVFSLVECFVQKIRGACRLKFDPSL